MAVSHIFSSPVADFTGTVTVFNSAGLTETRNATEIVRPSNWNSVHNQFMTLGGNTAGASTLSGTNIPLHGGNNITLSADGASLIFHAQSQSVQTQNLVSVQGSTGAIVFSNSNGISFGGNASTITASHNGLTSQSNQAFSAEGGSSVFQTLVFANSQGVSFSNSNGSVVGSVKTDYALSNHSHGNPTLALTNLTGTTDSNSAGLTISLSAANPGGGAAFTAGISGGNTSGDTGTVSNRIVFAGGNNVTVSGSTDAGGMSVTISGANVGGAQTGISGIQVSNTTYTSGTVTFQNANGISFGASGANGVSASYTVPTVTNSSWTVSDAGTSGTVGRLAFTNLNGVTLSLSTGAGGSHTIVGSHNALTTARASNDAIGLNTAQTNVTWTVNSSGLSFNAGGYAGTTTGFAGANISGSMTHNTAGLNLSLSVAAPGGGAAFTGGMSNIGNTAGTSGTVQSQMLVVGGPNITVSQSINGNSATLSISGNAPGAAAENNWVHLLGANTAGNTTASGSTVGFSGLNMTLSGTNNSQIVMSVPATSSLAGTGAISISTNGSTISIGVGTVTASATSNTTQGSSGTINLAGLVFAGAGGASVGVSNGSIVISGASPGDGATRSGFNPYPDIEKIGGQIGQGTLQFDPQFFPAVQFDRLVLPLINTNSSNSSGSHTLSFWVGIYSRNASTLSLLLSTSSSTALTHSGTAGSYSLYSGNRIFTIPMTNTITQGDYWIGMLSRTTSGGANGSYSQLVVTNLASNFLGFFGSSHNTTYQQTLGQGVYTATTNAIPGSVAFTQIRGSDSMARRAPWIMFASSTI